MLTKTLAWLVISLREIFFSVPGAKNPDRLRNAMKLWPNGESRLRLISAPMFCLVMFQGVSCHFESAASDSYSPMGQIEV
jgi:hypothetical protein